MGKQSALWVTVMVYLRIVIGSILLLSKNQKRLFHICAHGHWESNGLEKHIGGPIENVTVQ